METFIRHPERNGPSPAVFFLMGAHGIREELKDMARRLATVGYYVLLPNLYYRAGRDTIYGSDVHEEGSAEHKRMRATTIWRLCRWSRSSVLCLGGPAPLGRSNSTRAFITASPSRSAGASTSRPPSGIGSG
jgi:predicted alpha/beta-hydrolase family hydrolase